MSCLWARLQLPLQWRAPLPDRGRRGRRLVKGRKASGLLMTRAHLLLAGVKRRRHYENTATTMHVGFRSRRDTGITWAALAGVDVAKLQRRSGHDDVVTTIAYVKQAEDVTGTLGEPFPTLPVCLVAPDAADTKKAREWAGRRASPAGTSRRYGHCLPSCRADRRGCRPRRMRRGAAWRSSGRSPIPPGSCSS
jgi:hypothetical protein